VSDSRKDGVGGGAHRGGHWGREYWSARCKKVPMGQWGGWTKGLTHREERRAGRNEAARELWFIAGEIPDWMLPLLLENGEELFDYEDE
jgi:hypothetical protein